MLCATQLEWIGTSRITDQNGAAKRAVGVTQQISNNQSSKARTVGGARRTTLKKRGPMRLTSFKVHGGIVPIAAAAPCKYFGVHVSCIEPNVESCNTSWGFFPSRRVPRLAIPSQKSRTDSVTIFQM